MNRIKKLGWACQLLLPEKMTLLIALAIFFSADDLIVIPGC